MSAIDDIVHEAIALADAAANKVSHRYNAETKPRLAALLMASAAVAIRATAGEDVTNATIALESSSLSIAREEKALLTIDGRQLAMDAMLKFALKLAAAAAGA